MIYLFFIVIAIIMTMAGKGGGNLYVPIFLNNGIDINFAVSTSQLVILVTSFSAFIAFFKKKLIDWKLISITAPFLFISGVIGSYISSSIDEFILKIIFILIVSLTSILMIKPPKGQLLEKFTTTISLKNQNYQLNYFIAIISAIFSGLISGIIGIAGGSIIVPILIGLCGVPAIIAVASASILGITVSVSSIIGYTIKGNIDITIAIPFMIAVLFGGFIGAHLSSKLNSKNIKIIVLATNVVAVVLMGLTLR